jgi:hypothetical protein
MTTLAAGLCCGLLLAYLSLIFQRRIFQAYAILHSLDAKSTAASRKKSRQKTKMRKSAKVLREEKNALQKMLPLAMEELLMAVEAGHDVLSAMRVILTQRGLLSSSVERGENPLPNNRIPLSTVAHEKFLHIYQLTEVGLSFESALEQVAEETDSLPFRHAMLHLAVCHRDGGELIMPLRELSDATQLCYQEEVEEIIAKLPVRATPALICSFAGLLFCAMSLPFSSLLDVTADMVDLESDAPKILGERGE